MKSKAQTESMLRFHKASLLTWEANKFGSCKRWRKEHIARIMIKIDTLQWVLQ